MDFDGINIPNLDGQIDIDIDIEWYSFYIDIYVFESILLRACVKEKAKMRPLWASAWAGHLVKKNSTGKHGRTMFYPPKIIDCGYGG